MTKLCFAIVTSGGFVQKPRFHILIVLRSTFIL